MLAERIRATEEIAGISIIALTSGGGFGDSTRWEELGIEAELMKPVKQSELFETVLRAVAPLTSDVKKKPLIQAESDASIKTLNVLLAEDGLANQTFAVGLLKKWGHQVTVAENGKIAVDHWLQGGFDLILMDLQMPEMDGIDATKMIRRTELEQGGHIPIIAMTAHAVKGFREQCLEAGMDGYISKPVRKQQLYEAIKPFFGDADSVTQK